MSQSTRAWITVMSLGTVEALKDQGFCRWNHTIISMHQYAKNHTGSISQAKKQSPRSSAAASRPRDHEKIKQGEESMRKVIYLSCWGPN